MVERGADVVACGRGDGVPSVVADTSGTLMLSPSCSPVFSCMLARKVSSKRCGVASLLRTGCSCIFDFCSSIPSSSASPSSGRRFQKLFERVATKSINAGSFAYLYKTSFSQASKTVSRFSTVLFFELFVPESQSSRYHAALL